MQDDDTSEFKFQVTVALRLALRCQWPGPAGPAGGALAALALTPSPTVWLALARRRAGWLTQAGQVDGCELEPQVWVFQVY